MANVYMIFIYMFIILMPTRRRMTMIGIGTGSPCR